MSTALQIIGLVLVTVGAWLAWPPLAFALAGVGLLLLGALMERDAPEGP